MGDVSGTNPITWILKSRKSSPAVVRGNREREDRLERWTIANLEDGEREPQSHHRWRPLKAERGKEINSPLGSPERNAALLIL